MAVNFGNQAKKTFKELNKRKNAKVNRIKRNYGIDLSEDFKTPKSIDEFSSRKEYNAWKKQVGKLLDRKNQEYQFMKGKGGAVMSRKEFKEVVESTKKDREKAMEQFEAMKDLPYIENGEVISTLGERAKASSIEEAMGITMPKQFNKEEFDKIQDQRTISKKIKAKNKKKDPMHYDRKQIQMQQNYLEKMYFSLDEDDPKQKAIIDYIKNLNPNEFHNMYQSNKDIMNFNFYASNQKQTSIGDWGTLGIAISNYTKLRNEGDPLENF